MAGSVVFSYELSSDGRVVKLIYQCTSDGSGNVSSPTFTQQGDKAYFQPNSLLTGVIGQIRINPGSSTVQPTSGFAVQLNKADDSTLDFLGGLGASCSNTTTLMSVPAGISLFNDILVPYASGVGDSKQFTVKVYLWLKERVPVFGSVGVSSAALIASEAHIGETGGWSDLIKVTPTITVGAYSAQDMVGGKLTLSNAMRVVGGKGYLYSLEVIDTDKIAAALDIHLFSAMAGTYADNGAESISAADALNHLGLVRILASDYLTKANFSIAQPDPSTFKSIVLKSGVASRDLYAIVVCPGTPTYTHTTGLQFNFGIIGD